jgi:hypothetical protein
MSPFQFWDAPPFFIKQTGLLNKKTGMKKPFNSKITLFKSLFDSKETPFELMADEIYLRIRDGVGGTKELVTQIRQTEDKEERNQLKKRLKAILFAGVFTQRNDQSLTEHSGLMITDFDDFEDESMLQLWMDNIKSMPCAYMVFRSPSGNGIKAVIRIPKSTPEEHALRHQAFEKFVGCEYFDRSNKNVSRVCYESYDPDAYINYDAEEFIDIIEKQGFTYEEKPPILVLKNQQEIINRIMSWEHGSFVEGNRNNYIFKVACCFSEYGIDRETCESYLWGSVVNGSIPHQEVLQTIRSAYKKSQFDSKYLDDYDSIEQIKKSIQKGLPKKEIKQKFDVNDDVIEDVKEQLSNENDIFWEVVKKKTGAIDVNIDEWKYKEFLIKNGFAKYYPENAEKPSFVRVVENKVNLISSDQIKDFVLNYLSKGDNREVWNFCSRATYLFTEKYLNFIDSINLKMLEDDLNTCYIPFKNGVVKITKDNYELLPFLDVDGYIWEKQIINRVFKKVENPSTDFADFVSKVSDEKPDRFQSLRTTLGYLIHAHKDKSAQKAIIFNDQEIDENPNGGSGKSLMLTSLMHFRRMVKIDGKTFNPTKSDFVYQRVSVETQILAFDDVKKSFNFEQLFSLITEGIPVNRKNKDEFYLPFERSPKIVITTNYVINGAGGSHDRRRHEVEFNQFFNANHTPRKQYKKFFFDEWDVNEWSNFDNWMIQNVQEYLRHGLIEVESINANKKRFIQNTNKEFFDWIQEGNVPIDQELFTTDLVCQFTIDNKEFKDVSAKMIVNWIKTYANFHGLTMLKGKCETSKKRWIKLVKQENELF